MYYFNTSYLQITANVSFFLSICFFIFCFKKNKLTKDEVILSFCSSLLLMLIFIAILPSCIPNLVRNEFINGYATTAIFEEHYTIRYKETYTETYRDSKGKTRTRTKTRTVTKRIPDSYRLKTTLGSYSITREQFNNWNLDSIITYPNINHKISIGDGRIFTKNIEKYKYLVTDTHTYHNYLSASKSSLNEKNEELEIKYSKQIPKYPVLKPTNLGTYEIERIIDKDILLTKEERKKINSDLNYFNAKYSKQKQMNFFVILTKEKSLDFPYAIKSAWNMANKNDIILIISPGTFSTAIAYTEKQDFFLNIRKLKAEIDILKQIDSAKEIILKDYQRLPMETFELYKKTISVPLEVDKKMAITYIILQLILAFIVYFFDINFKKYY